MRWFKKIVRAILALLPMFLVSFCVTSPSYALSHELNGIRWAVPVTTTADFGYEENVPDIRVNGGFYISFYGSNGEHFNGPFPQWKDRDVFYSNYGGSGIPDFMLWYRMYPKWENGTCTMSNPPLDLYDLKFIGYNAESQYSFSAYLPYASDLLPENDYSRCFRLATPYSGELPFDQSSLSNILDIRGNVSPRGVYVDNMDPYWYSADGFWTKAHHINTSTGMAYNSAFYFSEMLGGVVPNKFSVLTFPVFDSSTDNSCTGDLSERPFDFKGVFRFDGSTFNWNPDLGNLSRFVVSFNSTGNEVFSDAVCTVNHVTVEGYQQLEFSCPTTFPELDPDSIITAELVIQGFDSNDNLTWVWDSDGDWSFGGLYIITDNVDTPGCSLHDDLTGNHIGGDYTEEDMAEAQNGAYGGLSNLFNFSFINPFSGIFDLFTNGDSCASIPTLASMIHSEETQVCPWFDSTTRNILTPVLGLSSMMLIFGFAVRWLKSSSGNDLIDTGGK